MIKKEFEALGTKWGLLIDAPQFSDDDFTEIRQLVDQFETQFSRFKEQSQVNAFVDSSAGTYQVSPVLTELLTVSQQLKQLTAGCFNPAVATLLSQAGYGKQFSSTVGNLDSLQQEKHENGVTSQLPEWSITGDQLSIDGPTQFDFGGIAKGYLIDQVSQLLLKQGYHYHLVDGGGDMVATTKQGGQGWKIALEYPGKTDVAMGTLVLHNQAFAGSDIYKRKWDKWHHLIDVKTNEPIKSIVACMVVAPSAFRADQLTSALFFSATENYTQIAQEYQGSYFVLLSTGHYMVSDNWQGVLFK
jgi:thiamine biosynthesis lipoprotein